MAWLMYSTAILPHCGAFFSNTAPTLPISVSPPFSLNPRSQEEVKVVLEVVK
jgi:hypothetical protein